MENLRPLLSICIPTYNRSEMLETCLQAIYHSIVDLKNVEIIVSDNASVDNTKFILDKWKVCIPHMRVFVQDINLGAEGNFFFLATRASGEYLWVFGDDDRFNTDTIGYVLSKLQDEPLTDVLILNFRIYSKDFISVKRPMGLKVKGNIVYNDKNKVLSKFGLNLGYISSIVVRRSIFLETSYEKYMSLAKTGFAFAFAIYNGLHYFSRVEYVARPMFDNRAENSNAYNWYDYFVKGSSQIFDELVKSGYSLSSNRSAKKNVIKQFIIHDILVRKRDETMPENLWSLLFAYYKNVIEFWIFLTPILCLPNWSIRSTYNLKLKMQKYIKYYHRRKIQL